MSANRDARWISGTLVAVLDKLQPVKQTGDLPGASKYVLHEELKAEHISFRQHPAIMIPALTSALGVLLGAAFATLTGLHDSALIFVVWIISVFMLLRSLLVIMRWHVQYIVITEKTFILTAGIMTRTVTAIPLVNLSGMTLEMTPTGRLMGYAAFRLGADSPVQLVIDYVPYPEQLYLKIRDTIRANQDAQPAPAAPVAQPVQPGRTRPAS